MLKLKPFQEKGVRTLNHFRGVLLLADEMGLGKTIQVLAWLKAHPEMRPAVIVSPAHLTHHWGDEARTKFGLRSAILSGRNAKPLDMSVTPPILIVSQEVLGDVTVKRTKGRKQVKTYRGWASVLNQIQPKVLAWDEAHNFKNRTAKRTKSLRKIAHQSTKRIAITGTALTNRPAELWATLNMLWPSEFPSFFSFALRYCKAKKLPWGWDFSGASKLNELHRRLKELGMLRRLKIDVLPELPPKQRTVLPLDIPMDDYIQARDNFVAWLEKKTPDKAKSAAAAEKIAQLGYLKRLAAMGKMPAIIQWIESYLEGTDDKLAVYGIHKDIIRNGLYERFKRIAVCIDGDTPQPHRPGLVRKFQSDRKYRLFFGNLVAAGTGIGLVAAPRLAFAELDWVPGNHAQVEDRIHRIGQTRHTEITYFVARGTIEEKLCKIIQSKQEVISAVLDGVKRKKDDMDIFNQLTKYLVSSKRIKQ